MNKRIITTIIIILLLFSAFVSINDPQLNRVALYIAIPFAFCLSIVQYGNPLVNNKYIKLLLLLYCWVGFTYFGAFNQPAAMAQMKEILGVILLSTVLANVAKNPRAIPWLYIVYIVLYIGAIKYAQTNLLNIIGEDERASDDILNANTLAYYTFYLTCAIYALGECIKRTLPRKIMRYLFFSVIFISVWIALITASRQVLIIQVPLFTLFLIIRYGTGKKRHYFYFVVAAILVWMLSTNYIETIFEGSLLQERYEYNLKDDDRTLVLKEAINVGNSHPIVGVGPGNFVYHSKRHIFSHCTYTELYANCGFMAALIYIIIILNFIITQFKRYKRSKDLMFCFFLIFGLFFALDNFFYVFYSELWLMSFFILIASHSETYYRLRQRNNCIYD